MKSISHTILAGIAVTAALSMPLSAAANDDAERLEALQRALTSPGMGSPANSGDPAPKRRTRAIVFDNQESAAEQAAPQGVATADVQKAARGCASVSPDSPGTAVDFTINFDVNSSSISSTSEPLLDQIAKLIKLHPAGCVVVEGHTDSSGNFDKNVALSRTRAESVVRYLSRTIEGSRLIAVGKGPTQPLKNLDPRHSKNRRVVFKVVI